MPFNPVNIEYHPKNSSSRKENPDSYESSLDLNEYCISHPSSTFFARTEGSGLEAAGIFSGDLLVVDRAAEPASGRIVLAVIAGEFVLRRLVVKNRKAFLVSDSAGSEPLEITPDNDAVLWGVVTGVIHKF